MNKIVVIGSINTDLVFTAARRPSAGETILGQEFKTIPGGKGANQAVAAAKLGADVTMVGCVGKDNNGIFSLENFQEMNVNTACIRIVENSSGVANIIVAENDNSIIVIPGANYDLTTDMIDEYKDVILSADIVMLQLEVPMETVEYAINLCYKKNVKTILNPGPAVKLKSDLIEKVTYLTPNEHEMRIMLGLDESVDIVDILAKYPNKLLITLGSEGVIYNDGKDTVTIPSFKVDVVDTTGAGDTFNGAFARAIVNGAGFGEAIRFANKAASISITKFGAQGGMPYLNEITEDN